uniref:Uncharacterized protein n=1 Tax=Plectus sambesii TaxID=2011161 RepID=A0A914VMZ3_9BILA
CYRNEHRQLEFFFVRCGYFAVDERIDKPQINRQTCSSLSCVLRSIPQIVRRVCESPAAADFMERMVEAFLRERIKLRKMKMLCRRQTLFF